MPSMAPNETTPEGDPVSIHPRYRILLAATGLVFLLVVTFVVILQRNQTDSSPAVRGPVAPQVQVIKPQQRDIARTITVPGNISPLYQATIYAKVPGYLKWIGVDKGDEVKKGQVLAVIEAPEVEEEYRQAEADYKIKRITANRLQAVWEENPDVVAKQDVDVAVAAAEAAKHLRDTRRQFLEYTKVTAPFSGTVTARFVDPGAFVQSAIRSATQSTPLLTIMDVEQVRVYVSVPQEAAFLAKPGTPASLTVHELPTRSFTGTITRTTEALDPATRTLLVEIDLPNADHALQPGMFVEVTLVLERRANALVLPPAALVTQNHSRSVFVVKDGRAHLTAVETGIDDGAWLEVVEGLSGEEDIVVVGKAGLTDGAIVNPSPYTLPQGTPSRQKY
ncbi:efflux RND transporter periplasmic adaptor subunit [Candidatus Nitrospira bockiana]